MKKKELGFGQQFSTPFPPKKSSLYALGKTGKLKEQIYLGMEKDDVYYTSTQPITKNLYKINSSIVLSDDGKLTIR